MGRDALSAFQKRPGLVAALLAAGWVACFLWALASGTAEPFSAREVGRGALAALGLGAPLEGVDQTIWRLRALRAATALAVGGTLALSGALLDARVLVTIVGGTIVHMTLTPGVLTRAGS